MDLKILIVDDDVWMTKLLNKFINGVGCPNTFIANGGFDAISSAIQVSPDLIFLDLMMPELDGMTTLKLLKIIPETQLAKVIICSANNDMNHLTKAIKAGAIDFISKPFTPETIKEKIDLVISKMGV
jgi:two-component system chemotaxis response regulator CheY